MKDKEDTVCQRSAKVMSKLLRTTCSDKYINYKDKTMVKNFKIENSVNLLFEQNTFKTFIWASNWEYTFKVSKEYFAYYIERV